MSTFSERVTRAIEAAPAAMAARDADKTFTWGDVVRLRDHLKDALAQIDAAPSARVGVVGRQGAEQLSAIYALWSLDRGVLTINPSQSPARLAQDVARLDLDVVIAAEHDLIQPAMAEALRLTGCAMLSLPSRPGEPVRIAARATRTTDRQPSDFRLGFSTSGTTGLPKRMACSGDVLMVRGADVQTMYQEIEGVLPPEQCAPLIMPYPLATVAAVFSFLYAGLHGRSIVTMEKFEVARWVRWALEYPQTVISVPVAGMRMLLDSDVDRAPFAKAKAARSGAAPLDDTARAAFESRFGIPILNQYGASEFCGIVTTVRLADYPKIGPHERQVAGTPREGVFIRTVDPVSGREIPPGVQGLLEVKLPILSPDWTRTTDLARIDSHGRLFIDGRADGAINRGGFKIVPEVISDALLAHPAVADAAAVGVPDARLGEAPVAAVQLREGASADEPELLAWLRRELLTYQVPVRIHILDALPRTATLKVDRGALRDLFGPAIT